jgi:cephalosporin hydroxylase
MKNSFKGLLIVCLLSIHLYGFVLEQKNDYVLLIDSGTIRSDIETALKAFGITFKKTSSPQKQDPHLQLIADAHTFEAESFPEHYIVIQTADLKKVGLSERYLNILSSAVTIWDEQLSNIGRYNSKIRHYQYVPRDSEYSDPILLPCLLPIAALKNYKNLVAHSNNDSDISSHLPTLFCYTLLEDPKLILEIGIRSGESTHAFASAQQLAHAHLLGIDIDPSCASAYADRANSNFVCMNDLDFLDHYATSEYRNSKFDVIFIDTFHLYEHTLAEIELFLPLLNEHGFLAFHDSNITPLNNNHAYIRLNGTVGYAPEGSRGVTQALKEYFAFQFDEGKYINTIVEKDGIEWYFVHYPFCNGLTVLKKVNN